MIRSAAAGCGGPLGKLRQENHLKSDSGLLSTTKVRFSSGVEGALPLRLVAAPTSPGSTCELTGHCWLLGTGKLDYVLTQLKENHWLFLKCFA